MLWVINAKKGNVYKGMLGTAIELLFFVANVVHQNTTENCNNLYTFGLPVYRPGCNHHKWRFRLGFSIPTNENHPHPGSVFFLIQYIPQIFYTSCFCSFSTFQPEILSRTCAKNFRITKLSSDFRRDLGLLISPISDSSWLVDLPHGRGLGGLALNLGFA